MQNNCALVIAHPGHELRIYHWVEITKPCVFVLTDGSGHLHNARLPSTQKILHKVGSEYGSIFGRFTDKAIYHAIVHCQISFFTDIIEELIRELIKRHIDMIVGDAIEGYNPSHDLCRVIIGATVDIIQRRCKIALANYDFPLVGRPDMYAYATATQCQKLILDATALERKLAVAQEYLEVATEVATALKMYGTESFGIEYLRVVSHQIHWNHPIQQPHYYETYGEKQVAAGYYSQVIRYKDHILPLMKGIQHYVETAS